MKILEPDYAAGFRCLAGTCPDTCCKDWEIILDEKTLSRYQALDGAFGEEVRAALTQDAEGDSMFRLTGGHCPLLRADGLCRVQLALGEEGLCETCRQHPRFYEEYGSVRELTLSLSCPAAAKLLLEHRDRIRFVLHEDGLPVSGCNDLNPERYLSLRRARDTAIAIVQTRQLSISDRLSLLLLFSVRLQRLLDQKAYGRLDGLLLHYAKPQTCKRELLRARRMRSKASGFFPCWLLLNNMEHLTSEFPRLLNRCPMELRAQVFDAAYCVQWEQLAVYFLWHDFLKAGVDAQPLAHMQRCIFHVLSIAALFSFAQEKTEDSLRAIASLYSKEVEHSEENLRLLLRVFERKTVSWKTLTALLR